MPLNDADRYIVLLACMGRVEEHAKHWDYPRHPPLLIYLQECIDKIGNELGEEWIKEQRKVLNKGATCQVERR